MANMDDLKKKAKDALDTIADVSAEAYKMAEEKAKVVAKWTKLNAEIAREKAHVRRLEGEIGKKYYELHKDDAEDDLKFGCEGITAALDLIAANKSELEEMKTRGDVEDAEVEECDCEDEDCDCSDESESQSDSE